MVTTRVLGLDLGQTNDQAAAVILETKSYPEEFVGPCDNHVRVRAIKSWALGTDYVDVCRDVLDARSDVLVPEINGVGRPFVDMLRREASKRNFHGRIYPVSTAPSSTKPSTRHEARGNVYMVPKIELVSSAVILQQTGRLRIPNNQDARQLLHQLAAFRMKITRAANQQFEARPGEHDDLVMALCLASWYVVVKKYRRLTIFC